MLPLHLLGGQNFDRPRSSVFICIDVVFVRTVKSVKVLGIEQAGDRDGGTGASMVRDKSKGCETKARDCTIELSKAIGSITSLLHHYHRAKVPGLHFLSEVTSFDGMGELSLEFLNGCKPTFNDVVSNGGKVFVPSLKLACSSGDEIDGGKR